MLTSKIGGLRFSYRWVGRAGKIANSALQPYTSWHSCTFRLILLGLDSFLISDLLYSVQRLFDVS